MSPFRFNLECLRAAAAEFAKQREAAEARVAEVNPVIHQIGQARLAAQGLQVVGHIVECWPHPESDTTTYNVAAIQVPDGVGVVRYELDFGEQLNDETNGYFVPFAQCEPSVQARLSGHIDRLLADLLRRLDIPESK